MGLDAIIHVKFKEVPSVAQISKLGQDLIDRFSGILLYYEDEPNKWTIVDQMSKDGKWYAILLRCRYYGPTYERGSDGMYRIGPVKKLADLLLYLMSYWGIAEVNYGNDTEGPIELATYQLVVDLLHDRQLLERGML